MRRRSAPVPPPRLASRRCCPTRPPRTPPVTRRYSRAAILGNQADLTVESAVLLESGSEPGLARYAFLVLITGRDVDSFHFNSINFQLIDDQDFQHDALFEGGMEPALDFGDLGPDQRVRGWLTFEASAATATLRLEYSPVAAIESATFGFLVPR